MQFFFSYEFMLLKRVMRASNLWSGFGLEVFKGHKIKEVVN